MLRKLKKIFKSYYDQRGIIIEWMQQMRKMIFKSVF